MDVKWGDVVSPISAITLSNAIIDFRDSDGLFSQVLSHRV